MNAERQRFDMVTERDDHCRAVAWAMRTLKIYRTAVLDKSHFASKPYYRALYIEAYLNLKQILRNYK